MAEVVRVEDGKDLPPEAVQRVADVVRSGGVLAFPTDTVYGLGASGLEDGAARRIFKIKSGQTSRTKSGVWMASKW